MKCFYCPYPYIYTINKLHCLNQIHKYYRCPHCKKRFDYCKKQVLYSR